MKLGTGGSSSLPLIVLYGVVLAMLIFALSVTVYGRQMDIRVQEEAAALAEELGETAFSALSGGQPFKDLPASLGGSPYTVEVDGGVFCIRITGGRGAGGEYTSVVSAEVRVENGNFEPGGRIYFYFLRENGVLLVSSSPIEPPEFEIGARPTGHPPDFYYFCRGNARAAAAMIAAYFALSETGHVITGYSEIGGNVMVGMDGGRENFMVSGRWDNQAVAHVEKAWVVDNVLVVEDAQISHTMDENLDNVIATGWLFSPSEVMRVLRSRTWKVGDRLVSIPPDPEIAAACVTTDIGRSYPVWRIAWENCVVYYRAMPWWENDDEPGFVMQSSPVLEPVI